MLDTVTSAGCCYFLGFPQSAIAEAVAAKIVPSGEIPGVSEHYDVFAVPNRGALFTRDGAIIPESARVYVDESFAKDRADYPAVAEKLSRKLRPAIRPPKHYDIVDEPVALIGYAIPHFGHFLTEGSARFWALAAGLIPPDYKLLFPVFAGYDAFFSAPYVRPVLEALSIPDRVMETGSKPILFRKVLVVHPSVNYSLRIFAEGRRHYLHVADKIQSERIFSRPVYLSRAGVADPISRYRGEGEIEEMFIRLGYEPVRPEMLSLADQIALFRTCPKIVGIIGSGFHTILYEHATGENRRIMFSPRKVNRRYPMIDAICSAHLTLYVNCIEKSPEGAKMHILNSAAVNRFVEQVQAF